MKKFIVSLLILSFLSINIITSVSLAIIGNVFKEGFYKPSDLNMTAKNYTVQNVSTTDNVYVLVFDKNHALYQSIRMEPSSPKYSLLDIEPDFRIAIVGNGEVFLSS